MWFRFTSLSLYRVGHFYELPTSGKTLNYLRPFCEILMQFFESVISLTDLYLIHFSTPPLLALPLNISLRYACRLLVGYWFSHKRNVILGHLLFCSYFSSEDNNFVCFNGNFANNWLRGSLIPVPTISSESSPMCFGFLSDVFVEALPSLHCVRATILYVCILSIRVKARSKWLKSRG